MSRYDLLADNIPDYKSFLTVEEMNASTMKLAEAYPDIVRVFEAGKSRQNDSILCMEIGKGEKNALCFGLPHPNEPIGSMTLEFLSRMLTEDDEFRNSMNYTWYIVKCADPDGTRLNEGWFKGPFNLYSYARHYYRPGADKQVEWTFPINYKNMVFDSPLPETKAIMKLMEEKKPHFVYSIHNSGFGGAYWYLNREMEPIYSALKGTALKRGISLNLGEPEAPYLEQYSAAIFRTMSSQDAYDYMAKYSSEPSGPFSYGTSSADYAMRCNPDCTVLLAEVPYFFDERIGDTTRIGGMSRLDAIKKGVEKAKAEISILKKITDKLKPYISKDNPFAGLALQNVDGAEEEWEAKLNWANSSPDFRQDVRVCELCDNMEVSKFYHSLTVGLTVRTAEFEIEKSASVGDKAGVKLLQSIYDEAENLLKQNVWELEQTLDYKVIPIQKLVGVQLESGLIVAENAMRQSIANLATF